jgi:hypothetical protein
MGRPVVQVDPPQQRITGQFAAGQFHHRKARGVAGVGGRERRRGRFSWNRPPRV